MKKKKVFIACDTNNVRIIKNIISKTNNNKLDIGYKFGLEFFFSKHGRKFLSKLKNQKIFLDLKLNEIPNTCVAAVRSLKDLKNIHYLTVHINGGYKMLKAVKKESKKINKKLKILGVSILTSLDNNSVRKIGHTKSVKDLVRKQAMVARAAGLNGIVCSGHEAKIIKNICKNMEIVTPGIRLKGDSVSDQKRVMTPKEAYANGSNAIVLGRSITSGNIKNNIQKLIKSL